MTTPLDSDPLGGPYTLADYGMMLAANVRSTAIVEALRATVRPGSVIVELGAGLGIFSLVACRFGAARAYGIESHPLVGMASLLAEDNGYGDRVIAIHGDSMEVTLPERVDVLLADLRGALPFYRRSVASIMDARDRFLKPGGVVIPRRDRLWAAVVSAPDIHAEITGPWREPPLGLDLHRAAEIAIHEWIPTAVPARHLVSHASSWAVLDYATVTEPRAQGRAECVVKRDGPAHGLCVWFDTELAPGVEFSCAPGAPPTIYRRAFFPWPDAVTLDAGDVVTVDFHVTPNGAEYTWTWESTVRSSAGQTRASWRQSTFLGQPFPASALRRRAHTYVPKIAPEGEITRTILGLVDGSRPLGELASQLMARFPERFADWHAALDRVAEAVTRAGGEFLDD